MTEQFPSKRHSECDALTRVSVAAAERQTPEGSSGGFRPSPYQDAPVQKKGLGEKVNKPYFEQSVLTCACPFWVMIKSQKDDRVTPEVTVLV